MTLPKVVRRGRIRRDQITPKGVRALNLAASKGKIWKHGLIGKEQRWVPSTANRTIDQLVEAGYTVSAPDNISRLRCNYALTERGALVASRLIVPSRRMSLPNFGANLGGGEIGLVLSNFAFGLTSGSYFSCPTGQNAVRIGWVCGDPVLGVDARICPKCGKVSASGLACDNCGASFSARN